MGKNKGNRRRKRQRTIFRIKVEASFDSEARKDPRIAPVKKGNDHSKGWDWTKLKIISSVAAGLTKAAEALKDLFSN